MKKVIILFEICLLIIFMLSNPLYAQWGGWVNNQGCYCGGYSSPPVNFISRGNGTVEERTATQEQMEYWNLYADIYNSSLAAGYGAPGNGVNEVNTFITGADAITIYDYIMTSAVYGVSIIQPEANFGNFDECKDFSDIGCGAFTETDVLINANFPSGWTTDPNNYSNALVQTTALHELGHTWGAHHVFTLPAFGDSYSTMNYINDDSGRFVTRIDANTIRAHYSDQAQSGVDVGIFPFIFGNSDYAETYSSVSPTSVKTGDTINISNFLIQNIGTEDATDTVITFYLSTDKTIDPADYLIGTIEYSVLPIDADNDLNASLPIPESVPDGSYYIGAIVTVGDVEDSIEINNKFIIGRPHRTVITVSSTPSYPGVASITSTTADGYYKSGDVINITLIFDEAVTLSGGNLNVTLETGAVDRTVSITPFTSSTSASGTYTVQAGDTSTDLNVNSLSLSTGATLKNQDEVNVSLEIMEDSNLADNKDIRIDTAAPDSYITSKPNYANSDISIGWGAGDDISGVASTELWYKKGSTGTWANSGLDSQTGTSGTFSYTPTEGDDTYYFDTRSTDNIGNVEAAPTSTLHATIYDTVAPSSTAVSPSYANSTITITWTASDERSGVASTQLWYKGPGGTWGNTGLTAKTGTSGSFSYTPTEGDGTYYFATRSTDNAGNVEASPTGSGDDSTIYDTVPPDPPSINDYSTIDDTVTLEGTCPGDTYAIYVNGSPNGVTYTPGETTWSYTGTLEAGENTFTVVAYDEAGNPSMEDTFTISSVRPDQPTISATNTKSLTPELLAGSFSHSSGDGYTHAQSQWQISTDISFSPEYLVLDVTSETHLTSLTVPHSILDEGTLYYCRVRFFDNQEPSAASDWSDPYAFTSITTTRDQSSNGIPDDQEVDDTVDLDNDGIPDNSQDDIKCVKVDTSIGEMLIGLSIENSTTVSSIEWLEVINPSTITDTTNRPSDIPLDLITFKLTLNNPGDTASVTVYFGGTTVETEDYIDTYLGSAKWYHYDTINGWQDYSSYASISRTSKTVRIQLTDGGAGDGDGTANSIIVDPSGIGGGSILTQSTRSSESSEEESGCFIDAVGF